MERMIVQMLWTPSVFCGRLGKTRPEQKYKLRTGIWVIRVDRRESVASFLVQKIECGPRASHPWTASFVYSRPALVTAEAAP